MFVPEEKEKVIGKNRYLIRALPAEYGLSVMTELSLIGETPPPKLVKDLVMRSVTCNNIQPTNEWFDRHFSKNYKELYELFKTIVDFNFNEDGEEGEGPNDESGTSET